MRWALMPLFRRAARTHRNKKSAALATPFSLFEFRFSFYRS
jgi:hypothetical protein